MAELIGHRILQEVEKPERIVVLLHGIGQHSGYMEEAGRMFSEQMPNTLVVMAEAPLKMHYSAEKVARIREKYDPGFDPDKARSWFSTKTSGWPLMALKLAFNKLSVVHQVNALADHYRDKYGLQDKDIAFFGMSQGGAISLYSAITRDKPVAAAVSHSGMFFGFTRAKSQPDVMMITGEKDDMLCDNKSPLRGFWMAPERSVRRLQRRDIKVTEVWCPKLGHEMTPESISVAADYLKRAFGVASAPVQPAPPPAPEAAPKTADAVAAAAVAAAQKSVKIAQ